MSGTSEGPSSTPGEALPCRTRVGSCRAAGGPSGLELVCWVSRWPSVAGVCCAVGDLSISHLSGRLADRGSDLRCQTVVGRRFTWWLNSGEGPGSAWVRLRVNRVQARRCVLVVVEHWVTPPDWRDAGQVLGGTGEASKTARRPD